MKYLNGRTFQEDGYLQEVNRLFFHPLGLALELDQDHGIFHVQDFREEPEGVIFADSVDLVPKAAAIDDIQCQRSDARMKALGYWLQPVVQNPATS